MKDGFYVVYHLFVDMELYYCVLLEDKASKVIWVLLG
jgi:hypothetical protein